MLIAEQCVQVRKTGQQFLELLTSLVKKSPSSPFNCQWVTLSLTHLLTVLTFDIQRVTRETTWKVQTIIVLEVVVFTLSEAVIC